MEYMKDGKIKLTPAEATAYWWINKIRGKVRRVYSTGYGDSSEKEFAQIFSNFTEIEWRYLYIKLTDFFGYYAQIQEKEFADCPSKNENNKYFWQDCNKGGHALLNEEIERIVHRPVPDINIAYNFSSATCNTSACAGERCYPELPLIMDPVPPTYIITGDANMLHFYNQLVATLAVISENSDGKGCAQLYSQLETNYCGWYNAIFVPNEAHDKIVKKFKEALAEAMGNGIFSPYLGWKKYDLNFCKIDYNGLDHYLFGAVELAGKVLGEENDNQLAVQFERKRCGK